MNENLDPRATYNVPVPPAERLPEPTTQDSTGDDDGYAVGE